MKASEIVFVVLMAGFLSGVGVAQQETVTFDMALSELRNGRPGIADTMFSRIIAEKADQSPELTYYAGQAAYQAGYYKRSKALINAYIAEGGTDALYANEAVTLRSSIDEAITVSSRSDADAYDYAQKKNTIFAYAAYRRLYPEGAHIASADFLSFRRAKELNVEVSYIRYVEYWPDGQYVDQAKRNADISAFKEARHLNTLGSYTSYLAAYPSGVFETQARQREEAMAYAVASKDGSVTAIKDFIARHPDGYNRKEAEKLLSVALSKAPLRDLSGPTAVIPAGSYIHRPARRATTANPPRSYIIEIPLAFTAMAHEVTFAQWDQCVREGGCNDYAPEDMQWGRENRPVINVNRSDIDSFTRWFNAKWTDLGGQGTWRLPSEMEWAYMARGTNVNINPQRIEAEQSRRSCPQCETLPEPEATFPVGSFKPNNFGLFDILGNVQEWVLDCWHENLNENAQDGTPWITDGCGAGVARGSSDPFVPVFTAQLARREVPMDARQKNLGFRLIRGTR